MSREPAGVAVYLEETRRRTFAAAFDWPGWCRSGRSDEAALDALAEYAPRYAEVVTLAGLPWSVGSDVAFDVVERVPGTSTTDFGAPDVEASSDAAPLEAAEAGRHADLVVASWEFLDRVAAGAPPELRRGPRGGGRDRDEVVRHVVHAEASYARKVGVRHRTSALGSAPAVAAMRAELEARLREPSSGEAHGPNGWRVRYASRRIAWHVLDHAWEIQDKS